MMVLQISVIVCRIRTKSVNYEHDEQEFDLGPLRDMTWMQLDGGFLYGAHEVDHHHNHEDGLVTLMSLINTQAQAHTKTNTHTKYI